MQTPIVNDCLKVSIDGHCETQLVPKLLLKVSVRKIHNSMVSNPEEGGLEEARDADNNIIISDSTLRSILTTQLKKMSARYKVMCSFECCLSSKCIHSSLLSWRDIYLKNLKDIGKNKQNRRYDEIANSLFETYKNYVMMHGRHIYAAVSDMFMATMCEYPPY